MAKTIIEKLCAGGIPIMTIKDADAAHCPIVFYIHGYSGKKEDGIEYGLKLASSGFMFVSFDCWLHGERGDDGSSHRRFTSVYPDDTGMDAYVAMHEVMEQANKDLDYLIKYFESNHAIDAGRVGLTGFSMGGFATYLIAANNPKIKAAVPIGGRPSFKKAWDDILLSIEAYDQWRQQVEGLTEESLQRGTYMSGIDPFDRLVSFCPRPLLMINGDRDTDQPYLYALELYRKLKPFYAEHPQNLQLRLPFAAHCLTGEIMDEACAWFKKHL